MRLGCFACLAILTLAPAAHAQSAEKAEEPTPELKKRTERMQLALTNLSDANHSSFGRTAFQLGWGSLFVGLSGYFAFSKNVEQGTGSSRGAAVILSMMTGATYLGKGVYSLTGVSTGDEKRLERFRASQRKGGITEADLARFEAELELEADHAKSARYWEAASSLGAAAGGVALITFGATSELRKSAREIVYIEGGVMLASGAGLGIYSLLKESAAERQWRDYRAGTQLATPSARPALTFQVTPVLAPSIAGLSVVGTF